MTLARLNRIPCARLFAAATLIATLSTAALAAGPYDINVVLPLTGSAAFVGQGERDSLLALQDQINASGGIADGKTIMLLYWAVIHGPFARTRDGDWS